MRLIDADKFKEYITGAFEDSKCDFKSEKYLKIAEDVTNGFLKDIGEQPTAYDVDKVLEQLRDLKAKDFDDSCEEPELMDGEDIYEEGRSQGRYEAYGKAIEIVKEGGVNGKV